LSGVANEAPVTGCGSYSVAVSGTVQFIFLYTGAWDILGSLTAVDLTPAPTGCAEFAGLYSCQSFYYPLYYGYDSLIVKCFKPSPNTDDGGKRDIFFGNCNFNGSSCSGTITLLQDLTLGWGGGTGDLTP
jgi:hypothetical protein